MMPRLDPLDDQTDFDIDLYMTLNIKVRTIFNDKIVEWSPVVVALVKSYTEANKYPLI